MYNFNFNLKQLSLLIVVIVLFIISVYNFDLGRGGYAIKMLFENPEHLFLMDVSVGIRVYNILIGIISVFKYPLGGGAGSYNIVQMNIESNYNLLSLFSADSFGNVSAFSKYSVEMGIIFWMLLLYFLLRSIYLGKFSFFALGFVFMAASFSIVFPPIWFLFAVATHKNKKLPKDMIRKCR
jgi:hypothetical protein